MSRRLADTLMGALADAGADALFGVPGGGPNLDKVGAGTARGMRFVLTHTETAGCIAASTYGLLTGQPGVAIVTRGPGIASAVNGAAQATLDRAPLVLVSDTVAAAQADRVPHQRLDQVALLRPATKWSGTLGTARPRHVAAAAAALATASPAGAVHLAFDATTAGDEPPALPPSPPSPSQAWRDATALLERARRPLLLAGVEAVASADDVRELVSAVGCPALMTYEAKGVVPDSWPNAGPLFTNGASERPLLEEADLILAVGLDPVEPIPAPWRSPAPVVAVHPCTLADAYFPIDHQLVGPIGDGLRRLRPHLRSEWEPDAGRRAKQAVERALQAEAPGFTPHQLVEAARAAAPDDATVTVDAGAHFLVVMPLWPVEQPRDLLISNGLATMGFALPAAIGAALARPRRPVLCFVGDGGLGMTLAELETLARLELDVAVVVFNDSALSLIEIKQASDHGGAGAVRYRPSDFAAVARAVGVPASQATDGASVERELRTWSGGPKLIDARIDPRVYRHVMAVTRG